MIDESSPGEQDAPPPPRPNLETLLGRAMRLKCPRCGQGPLFSGWFRMPERCSSCAFKFHRAPGYFLGSTYINYGLTALLITICFIVGRILFQIPSKQLVWPLLGVCLVFPLIIFRHSRALWLALDCQFDRSVLVDEDLND